VEFNWGSVVIVFLQCGTEVVQQESESSVDFLFGDIIQKYVYTFLNDLVVYSEKLEEHEKHLKVFRRLEKAGFTLNWSKVYLAQSEIKFLCHSLTDQGVKVLPERVQTI
jgi:hypothetical protein